MAMGNHVSAFQTGRAISMSNRQYSMIRTVLRAARSTVHVEEVMGWNQTTLGGCKRSGYLTETRDKRGITVTTVGRQALNAYATAEFYRKHASLHFANCLHLEPPAHLMEDVKKRKRSVGRGKSAGKESGRRGAQSLAA